jgi:hypothetical protein
MLTGYAGDERSRFVRETAEMLGMIDVPEDGGAGVHLPARRCSDDMSILAPGQRAVKPPSLMVCSAAPTNGFVESMNSALSDE